MDMETLPVSELHNQTRYMQSRSSDSVSLDAYRYEVTIIHKSVMYHEDLESIPCIPVYQ